MNLQCNYDALLRQECAVVIYHNYYYNYCLLIHS